MQKYGLLAILGLALSGALFHASPAYAYMDPSPVGSIFPLLAPLLALVVGFLAFMIRPFRRFVAGLISRLLRRSIAEAPEADEQSAPGDLPEGEGSGDGTSDDPES